MRETSPEVQVDASKGAYFLDFAAERKRGESRVSSAQFWGSKVILSWAQIEYNHGVSLKKWAEMQRSNLRFSEESCPNVLRSSLEELVSYAEQKAEILIKFYNQVEEPKGMSDRLVSYESKDYKPTMERLSKEMKYLMTSQKIKEARSKREEKKYLENMKKIREKEKLWEELNPGRTDWALGRMSGFKGFATDTVERYLTTVKKERSQRHDFLKYVSRLKDVWTKKQRERLCLLLTCIQSFVKKMKTLDTDITKSTPVKQIKGLIKAADINAIIKDMESQFVKVPICPENAVYERNPPFMIHDTCSLPRAVANQDEPAERYVRSQTLSETVTLPTVSDAVRGPESNPRPTVFRKLDNSIRSLTPGLQLRPLHLEEPPGIHTYASCGNSKKEVNFMHRQRQLLTPTTVHISAPRKKSSVPLLASVTPGPPFEEANGLKPVIEGLSNKTLKSGQILKPVKEPARHFSEKGANSCPVLQSDPKVEDLSIRSLGIENRSGSPTARPSTPSERHPKRRKCVQRAQRPKIRHTPDLESLLPSGQACGVFLKVTATARRNSVDDILKKHYGRYRKLKNCATGEAALRTLVLVKKSNKTSVVL